MSAAIQVSHVSKSFRRYLPDRPFTLQEVLARGFKGVRPTERFWALRDVSFAVPRGKATAIIGTNGSGKSTLLRLVGGIGTADEGDIRVGGRIGALLDLGSGINSDLTGRENVIVAGVLSGLTRREVLRRFDAIVAFAEIEKFIDNPMRTYSSGMQMRLAFAINVHADPDILLIDEVLAVGDSSFQRKCLTRINEFKARGCSILLVSHGLAAVQKLCDDVLWMHKGQLMAHGTVREVVSQYEAHVGFSMEPEHRLDPAPAVTDTTPAAFAAQTASGPTAAASRPERPSAPWVTRVALLDPTGHPLNGVRAGAPLNVVIDFTAAPGATAPRFEVRVVREDGLVCCDLATEPAAVPARRDSDTGRVTLVIDRLDLNAGHYSVDVTAHHGAEAETPAASAPGCPLLVQGEAAREGVLAVPHRWQFDA